MPCGLDQRLAECGGLALSQEFYRTHVGTTFNLRGLLPDWPRGADSARARATSGEPGRLSGGPVGESPHPMAVLALSRM
jgi:hypothetical protein